MGNEQSAWTDSAGGSGAHEHALSNVKRGTADPSAAAGVVAPIASLYLRDNGGAGELWVKTGAAATAWTKLTIP